MIIFPLILVVSGVIYLILFLINYNNNPVNNIYNEIFINITSDQNNTFNISFKHCNDHINITAYYVKNYSKEEFETKIDFSGLKYYKYLSICNTIKDAYEQIILELNKNTTKNIVEKNDYINLIIPIEYISIRQIIFKIPKKIKSENEKLLEKIELLENKYKVKTISVFDFSSIIKNNLSMQYKLIELLEQKLNKSFILELIFKMNENGFTSEDFHYYCDDKGPTLTLIKTKNDEIFGGFTPLNWKATNTTEIELDNLGITFIFSLNLNKKYDIVSKEKDAIRNNLSFGPIFGGDAFFLRNNLKEGVTWGTSQTNFFSDNNLELIGKKGDYDYFETMEVEVYKVIY